MRTFAGLSICPSFFSNELDLFLFSVSIFNHGSDYNKVRCLGRTTEIDIKHENSVISTLLFTPFDEYRKLC